MNFKRKKIVVLGAGESGIQSAVFLKKRGASVFLSELKGEASTPEAKKELERANIAHEFGRHSWERIREARLVIMSPGIPPRAPIYQKVVRAKIPIWSEIELAYRASPAQIIAVTGTNGKTTVTTLIQQVLAAAGRRAVSCGNIGNSFIREIDQLDSQAVAVVEVSSFQLVHIDQFKPHIAVLLNLSANHFDWHSDFGHYADSKWRIFKNQTAQDYAVINRSDAESMKRLPSLGAKALYFDGSSESPDPNLEAVERVAEAYGVPAEMTQSVFARFKGLNHRLEQVGMTRGVRYVNDSKSTTIASLEWALKRAGAGGPVILIMGGRHKGGEFTLVRELVRKQVKFLVAIGEATSKIEHAFGDLVSVYPARTLEEAVRAARGAGRPGDTVLFSPACASFDMFANYQDRGEKFKGFLASWIEHDAAVCVS